MTRAERKIETAQRYREVVEKFCATSSITWQGIFPKGYKFLVGGDVPGVAYVTRSTTFSPDGVAISFYRS